MIEPKLNEMFELNGKRFICKKTKGNTCFDCCIENRDCCHIACGEFDREDKEDVFFEEVKDN